MSALTNIQMSHWRIPRAQKYPIREMKAYRLRLPKNGGYQQTKKFVKMMTIATTAIQKAGQSGCPPRLHWRFENTWARQHYFV